MLSFANKLFMPSVAVLNVVMLNVIMLSVVVLKPYPGGAPRESLTCMNFQKVL